MAFFLWARKYRGVPRLMGACAKRNSCHVWENLIEPPELQPAECSELRCCVAKNGRGSSRFTSTSPDDYKLAVGKFVAVKASDFNKSQQLSANADRRPSLGPISDFHPQIAIRERARLSEGATRSNVEFPAAVELESYPVRQAILYNHQL